MIMIYINFRKKNTDSAHIYSTYIGMKVQYSNDYDHIRIARTYVPTKHKNINLEIETG